MNLQDELEKLIKFRPVTSSLEACSTLLEYEENLLTGLGLQTKRGTVNGHTYLIASSAGDMTKSEVLLQAHIDVVPAGDGLMRMTKAGDKLGGRGTYDMLFAVACFNKLLADLRESGDLTNLNIGVMLTSDEEIGGEDGVGRLFEDYTCAVCVLPDAGTDKDICIEAKGVLQLKVKIAGIAGHGARPWLTDSPILKIPDVISRIQKLFPNTDQEATTCSFTQVHSGSANNQVPSEATLVLDIRFEPADDPNKLRSKVVDSLSDLEATVEDADVTGSSYATDVTNPHVQKFMAVHKEVSGHDLGTMRAPGSSDARFITPKGIPVIMTRPDGGGLHGDDEWVSASSLEEYYQILKKYILTFRKV